VGIAVGGGFFGAAAAAVDATTNTAGSVAAAAGGGGGNWVDTAGGEAPRGIPIDEKQYRDVYDIAGEIGSGAYSKVARWTDKSLYVCVRVVTPIFLTTTTTAHCCPL
jgi:hypothetical protein